MAEKTSIFFVWVNLTQITIITTAVGKNFCLIVNKRIQSTVLGCDFKSDRIISVRFQGKAFNITVIQVYALTANAKEAELLSPHATLLKLMCLKPVLFNL